MDSSQFKLSLSKCLAHLQQSPELFLTFFSHGSLEVELYQPHQIDKQQPHERDEVYVVASGSGTYICGEELTSFQAGDFLFAPAGVAHRFVNFTEDFSTWVLFYGPKGGEQGIIKHWKME